MAKIIDKFIPGIPCGIVAGNMLTSLPFDVMIDPGVPDEAKLMMVLPHVIRAYLIIAVIVLAVFIVQAFFLTRDGQTLGKKAMAIRIVLQETGKNGGFSTNVLLRTIVNGILSAIPFYALIDILFIFRDDRRCVHDMLAGTVVVKA